MHLQVTPWRSRGRKEGAEEGNRSPAGPPIKLGGESLARVQTTIPRWGNNIWSKFGICLLSCQLLNPGELVSGHFEIAPHFACPVSQPASSRLRIWASLPRVSNFSHAGFFTNNVF